MRRTTALLTAAPIAVATMLTSMPHADAATTAPLQFRKFVADPPGNDLPAYNSKLNSETIALKNTSTTRTFNLKGYVIYDRGNLHRYSFPSFTLRPGATVTLHTGKGTNNSTNVYWNKTGYVWNNDKPGDTASLNNSAGHRVAICTYTKNSRGYVNC